MLRLAIDTISPSVEALNIYETYTGLVKTATRQTVTDNGTKEERFPVAFNVTNADCFQDKKRFKELIPNTKKKNIAYWEGVNPMQLVRTDGNILHFEGRARLISWVNIKRSNFNGTGATDFSVSSYITLNLIKALNEKEFYIASPFVTNPEGAKVRAVYRGQEAGTKALWNAYSYDALKEIDINALTLWPYELISNVFDLYVTVSQGCIAALALGTEIDC